MTERSQIPGSAIERSRPAGVSDGRSDLEAEMLFAVRAAGLPEPVRELHFAWCCEHPKSCHHSRPVSQCSACSMDGRMLLAYHRLARLRDWRFDLAWPQQKVALELQGGIYAQGRHSRGAAQEAEYEKHAEAVLRGWRVLYAGPHQVEDGTALAWLERVLGGDA